MKVIARPLRAVGVAALVAAQPASAGPQGAALPADHTVVAERPLVAIDSTDSHNAGSILLARDRDGNGSLYRRTPGAESSPTRLACGPLEGAWGLWIEDVDGDEDREAIVALRKRARFDPVLENRLHVYALVGDRCVPLWRGTRLAGRFDEVNPSGGRLIALERIGKGRRRVARYRWTGFGYALDEVLWIGKGKPPKRLLRKLEH